MTREVQFRDTMTQISCYLQEALGTSLTSTLYAEPDGQPMRDPRFTQTALFALQCALSAHWHDWGVSPSVVTGHSLGEYAAACVAGAISIEDAALLVAERGRLTRELPDRGLMAVVFTDEQTVRAEIARQEGHVAVAAVNAPQLVVVSGPHEACASLLRAFELRGIEARRLEISHALHCSCADPMLDRFERAAERVRFGQPRLPFASTLEGRILDVGEIPGSRYWRRHARESVKFLSVVRSLEAAGLSLFVELGPHATLTGSGERCLEHGEATWLPSLKRGRDDLTVLSDAALKLWLAGVEVELAKVADALNWRYLGPCASAQCMPRVGTRVEPFGELEPARPPLGRATK